ncbi:MAG TPA: hypothetical protein DEG09_10560 [Marinilabiliaceae bacterium]|nr:hypothetical protein [Marinilabiliaceae bacterium]
MRLLILFLISGSLFLRTAAAAEPDLVADRADSRSIIGVEYNSLLYRSMIKFRNYEFSGLVLVKNLVSDSAVHIVFMSEFGPTMLDIKYKNDEFELISAKEFFNNEKLLGLVYSNFRMFLQDLDYVAKIKDETGLNKETLKMKYRHLSDTFIYLYEGNFEVGKVIFRANPLNVVKLDIERNAEVVPTKLIYSYRGVPLDVSMELIKYKP